VIPDEVFNRLVATAAADGIRRLAVGAVIRHQGAVLLLKRPVAGSVASTWELPGGVVAPGETLADAVIREVCETSGLLVIGIPAYLGDFDYQSDKGKNRQFNFAVTVAAPTGVRLTRHEAHLWAPAADDLPVSPAVRAVLGSSRAKFQFMATPAEEAAISAAILTRQRCVCQEEEGAPPCECAPPVTREQIGRLLAYLAEHPGRTVICSELVGQWMAALSVFLPAGPDPLEAWMRQPFALPPQADLLHADDLHDLLDKLGAPSAAALS
jgi:8-oxo-dGTP diphosphatase